ncbi:MAG: KH domain-containing protein [Deltaproteobacteria bacterium]|nr:MAG: KH domain-containing protein [Deltaproteobacteria bacterium]
MDIKDLVEFIAKSLVDSPDQVRVSETEGEHTMVIELEVAKEDIGKVIGRRGRTAQAVRTILGAASAKLGKKAVLEIVD